MKKCILMVLVILLLAVPVFAQTPLVVDESGLLMEGQVGFVEETLREVELREGFTPVVVTIDSFGGLSAEEYAGNFYDAYGYGDDGVLLLVSIEEGQWYVMTNGLCAEEITDYEASLIGETILPDIREGLYYEAFTAFPELAVEYMQPEPEIDTEYGEEYVEDSSVESTANGVIILICMAIGVGIGILVMGYMSAQMKTVVTKEHAADYIRPGSMKVTYSRDLFLYSQVTKTPKPKNNSSGGSGRSSSGGSHSSGGGGSRGGAGGRI